MRSMIMPPPPEAKADFAPGFGTRFILTIDTEEEFNWDKPLDRKEHGTDHVPRLEKFQTFCENQGVAPIYLVDWPIANSRRAAEILTAPLATGKAEIGVQLHPWVNPPFEEEVNEYNSYAGNLSRGLEEQKAANLRKAIEDNFSITPLIYRAGRYGLGSNTAEILSSQGIAIDSSVRPHFDYSSSGGPNYQTFPLTPYWVDDKRTLLELPLTTTYWGLLRKQGDWIYPRMWRAPALRGILARLSLLERIPLTPEGVSVDEAIRGIDIALDDGLPLLVLSFHSPSLRPGDTPYVRSESELDDLYDWWRRIIAYLTLRGIRPTTVREIMDNVVRS